MLLLRYGVQLAIDIALNIDVIPAFAKETETTGKFAGFSKLTNTAGLTIAPAATSLVVSVTGSYFLMMVLSIVFTLIGILFILWIKNVR